MDSLSQGRCSINIYYILLVLLYASANGSHLHLYQDKQLVFQKEEVDWLDFMIHGAMKHKSSIAKQTETILHSGNCEFFYKRDSCIVYFFYNL